MNGFGAIQEISLEGFQTVSSDMFKRPPQPIAVTMTLWDTSIGFSKAAIFALNCCERIRIHVHPTLRCILIAPTTENDAESIRWLRANKAPASKKMGSASFGEYIYTLWGLDPNLAYKTTGRIVSVDNKVMLLFDFSNAVTWKFEGRPKEES